MSIDATNWAWSQKNITSTEKLVLLSYADRAGESMEAWPSKKRLEQDTCLCFNSITKAIKSLASKGLMIKTGEVKNQVPVYRLIGVTLRESMSEKSKKHQPPPNIPPPKSGVTTPPKYTPPTPPKFGIQNHNRNPKRNPNVKPIDFDSFSDFKTFVTESVEQTKKQPSNVLIEEVLFYAEKFKDKRPLSESASMAINLIKKGIWKTPHGYNGFNYKEIIEKDEAREIQKQCTISQDAKISRMIHKAVMGEGFKQFQEMSKKLRSV